MLAIRRLLARQGEVTVTMLRRYDERLAEFAQTLNDALYQLYVAREVAEEECLRVSSDQNEFLRMIGKAPLTDDQVVGGGKDQGKPGGRR